MKCEFCGANIDIETDVCPHCGMTKAQFKQHREDIKSFKQEYDNTKDVVVEKNRRATERTVRVAIVVALCLMNVVMIVLIGNAYKIKDNIKTNRINSNKVIYKKALDSFEENEDYIGFYSYYNYNQLGMAKRGTFGDTSSWIDEYSLLERMCVELSYCVEYISEIKYYLNSQDGYYDINRNLENFVDAYEGLLKLYDDYVVENQDSYMYKPSCYSEKHLNSYENIMQYMEWYIEAYMGISEEDYPAFKTASKARKIIMIEEGLSYESQ